MRKKNYTKTKEQIASLQAYFRKHRGAHKSQQIIKLSRQIGLSKQRVYKWLWDQKNMQRQRIKLEYKEPQEQQEVNLVDMRFKNSSIRVPENKQQASHFYIRDIVSPWAISVLIKEGWQLVRDTPINQLTIPVKEEVIKEEDDDDYDYRLAQTIKKSNRIIRKTSKDEVVTAKKPKKISWDLPTPQAQGQQIYYSDQ